MGCHVSAVKRITDNFNLELSLITGFRVSFYVLSHKVHGVYVRYGKLRLHCPLLLFFIELSVLFLRGISTFFSFFRNQQSTTIVFFKKYIFAKFETFKNNFLRQIIEHQRFYKSETEKCPAETLQGRKI